MVMGVNVVIEPYSNILEYMTMKKPQTTTQDLSKLSLHLTRDTHAIFYIRYMILWALDIFEGRNLGLRP